MSKSFEQRIGSLERTNRRYRVALVALALSLAGSVMLGLQKEDEKTIDGFTAVNYDSTLTYFRLVNRDTVEILDKSRGDRWFWRTIRNWPK